MRPIVLTLMLVLLLTGSGEAGQATCPQYYVQSHKDDYRYASARIYADTEEEVGQCVLDLSFKDQIIYKWERLPVSRELRASVTKHQCYQRMQEAMQAMDKFTPVIVGELYEDQDAAIKDFPWIGSPPKVAREIFKAKKQWNQVMRDCVKEAP